MATTRKTASVKTATRKTATRKTTPRRAATVKGTAPQTPAKTAKPSTAAKPVAAPKTDKKVKAEKVKVVRDSFTIPKSEYIAIAEMKKRALKLGAEVKKSELIRAGLALLAALPDAAFAQALAKVPTLKTGRPGKA